MGDFSIELNPILISAWYAYKLCESGLLWSLLVSMMGINFFKHGTNPKVCKFLPF